MKQFKVVALSSTNRLLVLDNQKNSFEFPIEGFKIVPGPASRPLLEDIVGKTIDCTLNKAGTHIRYQNQSFLTEKIEMGVMEVIKKELQESKIYNADQKARLMKCEVRPNPKSIEVVDIGANRKELLKMFPRGGVLKGNLEWLQEEIVVSFQRQGKIFFLPLRLKSINTLFQCLPESTFTRFIEENFKIEITIERPIYNLVKKRFELVGSLKPKLELEILNEGWGIINTSALASISDASYEEYLQAEGQAKEAHKGVFSRNCEILAFIYAKNNFVGEVSDVLDGYIFEITKKGGGKVKLELAMVRCPVGDEVGAFSCKQFSRKQLIGQEVNVYLHKDSGLNITGSLIRVKDSKDVEALLVEQGWGFIREEFANSILSLKLCDLQKKAKEKGRGLYSKEIGVQRPEDLTGLNTQKEEIYYYRRDETLKRLGESQSGVLEGMVDLVSYKVWIEDKNVILKVKLQGIQGHNINPLLQEVKKMKEDHKELYEAKLKKRSVYVSIVNYQRETNSFIGTITLQGGKTLQQILLLESLVYCDRELGAPEKLKTIQKKVREQKRGLWCDNLINFEPVDHLQLQSQKFKGKFSWVEDGQVVFVQPQSNYKTLDMIAQKLASKNLSKVPKESLVTGSLIAAPYFEEYYRALIISIKSKKVKVVFIDWGNKQTVEEGQLRELPEQLKFIQKQCFKARLYLTKPIRNEQYLQRIRNELMDGEEYQFKKEVGQYISSYKNKQNINLSLIERGIAKGNTDMASASLKEKLEGFEAILKKNKVGVWEWSDQEEEKEKIEEIDVD